MISYSAVIGGRRLPGAVRSLLFRQFSSSTTTTAGESTVQKSEDVESKKDNSSETSPPAPSTSEAKGGFVKAMAKLEGRENFPKAIKFSPLVQMGDPQGKIAEGTIVHIVDDDLYIDFGGKFNCVCPRPYKNGSVYTLGKRVRVMIHDLELSTRFLGAESDLTILEADCSLLGLARRERMEQPTQ